MLPPWAHLAPGHSAALLGETLNPSPPTAVVDLVRRPEGDLQTPILSSATCSLKAYRVVTSVPSGSTPAADDAASDDKNVAKRMFQTNNPTTEPASFSDTSAVGSCTDASVNVKEPASCRARFFCHVRDKLPPTASITLPFSAQDILALHPTVTLVCGSGHRPRKSCVYPWQQTAATERFAAYLATQPVSKKKTGKRNRSGNKPLYVALAFFARKTLVALRDVLTLGFSSVYDASPAPNLAYADLLELQELSHDVLLHRDTSERRKHQIFEQLDIFAKDSTSPFCAAFGQWHHRYEEWQEASARTFGICRIPTATDFLRQDMEGDPNQNLLHHPFYFMSHCYC